MKNKGHHLILSIIIPVYNVESYVEKCLRSCAEQDVQLSDYEIIVINDGTRDNSLAIVERVAKEYSNITIVSQENAGLGIARNKGLFLASGNFVWFIDSDDWIESNCLKPILKILSENSLDALMISAANVVNGKPVRRNDYARMKKPFYSGIELLKSNYWEQCVPFTIYNRKFLRENNLKFLPGIFHEDSEFTPRSYFYAKRIAVLNNVVYFVCINPGSITRSVNHKKAFDQIKVAKSLSAFSQSIPDEIKPIFNNFISLNINNSLHYSYLMDNAKKGSLSSELKKNRSLFKHLIKSTKVKYRLEGILFYLFPNHCILLYYFLQIMNRKHDKLNIERY